MADHKVVTTYADIENTFQRAKSLASEPRAQSIEHVPSLNLLIVQLTNGRRLVLPAEDVQGLGDAKPEQLQKFELIGGGTGISFPSLDVDLYVPALIEGVYGNRRWMSQLGQKGGRVKSPAKRRAAQSNGAKGGRPKRAVA